MSDRPILFSAPMVRAIIDGRKTQTRRVVKPQPPKECGIHYMLGNESWLPDDQKTPLRHHWEAWHGPLFENRLPKHLCGSFEAKMPCAPGDRLYVRETWSHSGDGVWSVSDARLMGRSGALYAADGHENVKWLPSIHMPREFSRLTLIVTEVKVERLQSISEEDAKAEGVFSWAAWLMGQSGISADDIDAMSSATGEPPGSMRAGFAALWESINSPGSWKRNDWVAAITFRAIKANIDALALANKPIEEVTG